MTEPIILLDGIGERARLVGAGGSVIADQGRLALRGPFRLEVAGFQSDPSSFDMASAAFVAPEGDHFRLLETADVTEFIWPATVRLTDASDQRAPWLRFSLARLRQPRNLGKALVSLDRLAASLVGNAPDGADDTFAFPARNGRITRPLTKPSHPEFPGAAGYFLYALEGVGGVMLGTLSQRANLSHAEAVELVLFQGRAELWFRLPATPHEPATFLARSVTARGISLTAAVPGAGGVLAATDPGARRWAAVDLTVQMVVSEGGRLRVARDAQNKGGFADGQIWMARAGASTPLSDATGVFSPTDRLTLDLELPLDADIVTRLPEMHLGYRGRDSGSRYDRFFGIRVAGLTGRTGAAVALDADYAAFELCGSKANPSLHLKGGVGGHWLAPKPVEGQGERRLEISAGDLGLVVEAEAAPTATALELDTERELFTLKAPSLVAAPVGVTSQAPPTARAAPSGFKRWTLRQIGPDPKLELRLTPAGLRATGDWASGFATADPTQSYAAIDHPGMGITVDGAVPRLAARAGEDVKTTFTVKQADGLETVVYSAFVALLAYVGVRRLKDGDTAFLDPYKTLMQFTKLDESPYVKKATAKGLQLIYVTSEGGVVDPGAAEGLHSWIESNRAASDSPAAKEFFWPFAYGLHVQLRSEATGAVEYADDIVRREHPDIARELKPAIAFDMSSEAVLDATALRWTSWDALAAETPAIWPRANNGLGARMDPSVAEWRGIVMRDLPLKLALNLDALAKMPEVVQSFVKTVNKYLMLKYAFRDEAGFTWKGGITGLAPAGEKISYVSWDGMFEVWVHDLTVLGAGNATRAADCDIEFVLPKLKNKHPKPSDPDDSVRLRAKFGLDFESKTNPVGRVDVQYSDAPLETDSIPGFESVAIKRIATDLETVQVEVELVATPTLAEALPFLSNSKPQPAYLAFNLKGPPAGVFELSLPSEVETNLFGRWPLKVQSMRLGWGKKADVWLEVTGRLNLGLASLSSVGATVQITETGGRLDFDVRLNDVAVALSLGGAEISGRLGWGDKDPEQTKVPLASIIQPTIRDRDIRGALQVKSSGFLGDNNVAFRAGNKGEISYWVASAVHSGSDAISLGFGKLKNPGLLIAQSADLDGNLRTLALSPEGAVFANLRPTGPAVWDWLNRWEPSAEIGTVLAASGYFETDDVIVKAPVDDTQSTQGQERWLSGVLWIDTGVLRVDGRARLITDEPAYFGMSVDFKERTFFASFQTGPIKLGRYTFQPGRLALGFGFGDRRYLELLLGWPPRIGEFDRDWSQALHFHLPEMPPPVNAGWGGLRASIKDNVISFGIAFRVGWMRGDGPARGGSGGGYSIGYALGGLMEFTLSLRIAERGPAAALQEFNPAVFLPSRTSAYAAIALTAAAQLERTDFAIAGEWFGDVWGSAWLEFMGITLVAIDLKAFARYRLAGSLNHGITDARATCGFSISVTILCITYTCEARYDIVAVDGGGRSVRFDEFSALGAPVRAVARRRARRMVAAEVV